MHGVAPAAAGVGTQDGVVRRGSADGGGASMAAGPQQGSQHQVGAQQPPAREETRGSKERT